MAIGDPKRLRRDLIVGVVAVVGALLVFGVMAASSVGEPSPEEPATEVAGADLARPTTSTTTAAPTTSTTTTEAPPPPRGATLAFTGDTLAHRGVVRQARTYAAEVGSDGYDFGPMFELVRPYIEDADIAICHLETPLSATNTNLSGYPTFNVPGDLADALVGAGYDGCSTASNHSLDRRADGVIGTLEVLDEAGLAHSGMSRSPEERSAPTIYDAAGIAVANLSYSYGFNGFAVPSDRPWLANKIDVPTIIADAAAAREHGAEYVVVSLHWGTEYRTSPDGFQQDIADRLADVSDIDLIIGHHAHVVQPVDVGNDRLVVYGLGNFLSNQSAVCCASGSQDGVIMQVHIDEEKHPDGRFAGFSTSLSYVPTWVDRDDFTIVPVVDALSSDDLSDAREATLTMSRERTKTALTSLGADRRTIAEVRAG